MRGTQKWPPANGNGTPAIPVGDGKHSDGPELVGYARVSVRSQNDDSQVADLTAAGCTRIFIDHGVSGKLASRPELDKAVAYMRPGDTFVITRLSRAMRSLKHLLTLTDEFKEAGIGLKVLKQEIDTTTSTGRLIFKILGAIDEWQRELIVEGTLEGLEAAKAKGHVAGRKRSLSPGNETRAMGRIQAGEPIAEVARSFNTSRSALYRAAQRRGILPEPVPGADPPRPGLPAEKKAEIMTLLNGGANYTEAAEAAGVSHTTAQTVWKESGARTPPPGRGMPRMKGHRLPLSAEKARQAQVMLRDGETMTAVAKALRVSRTALYSALDRIEQASDSTP